MSARSFVAWASVAVLVIVVLGSLGIVGAPASAATPRSGAVVSPSSSNAVASAPGSVELTGSHATPAAPSTPTGIAPGSRMATTLAAIRGMGIPAKYAFLPNLNANPHPSLTNGHITPLYGNGPAPYGVADFGLENVSGTITPYTLSAPSLEGTFNPGFNGVSGLAQDISGPDEYGVQLNAVLNNVQILGTPGYEYWTQNVVEYSTYSHQLFFVSNIWNFSGGPLAANTFSSIGPNGTVAAPSYYYGLGGPITVSYPFTLDLFLNSTVIGGRDAVFFNFTLSSLSGFWRGSYDNVTFNSLAAGSSPAPTPEYVAEGSTYNPIGLTNDFEMVLGGPGGGSNFDVFNIGAYFGLQYWNTTTASYETVPSAYGYGSETGETSYGVNVMWGTESSALVPGVPEPNAYLTTGASNAIGLWNVSGQGGYPSNYGGYFNVDLSPSNAFLFLATGNVFATFTTTNYSLYQWLPPATHFEFEAYPGTYSLIAVAANYDPIESSFTITAAGLTPSYTTVTLPMVPDTLQGVYTPLWALNNSGLANISNNVGGNLYLFSNQYSPIGYAPNTGATFPWFGISNDFLFPVFPGIFLWNTSIRVNVLSPPSFQTYYPSWYQAGLLRSGYPVWNDLQMLFWNDSGVTLSGASSIGGWWPSGSYFGPIVSAYNVVFWNSSFSVVSQNNFVTGGNALYMYGGTDNLVVNNSFTQSVPPSPNPAATVAGAIGSVGLFEADYGNAQTFVDLYGGNLTDGCFVYGYCDVVWNNLFDTQIPAYNPFYDPYYFFTRTPSCPAFITAATGNTTCYFQEAWNVPHLPGPNIIGGPFLGGNFWWNYGDEYNPWSSLPYYNYEPAYAYGIENTGDYHPLAPVPLYAVTVSETGIPLGTLWYADVYQTGTPSQYEGGNSTIGTTVGFLLPAGTYVVYATSNSGAYAAPGVDFVVTNSSETVDVVFTTAYTLLVKETGLPSGGDWEVELYSSSGFYYGGASSTTSEANVTGLLAGGYTVYWYSYTSGYGASPYHGAVTISGNTTYSVAFSPLYTVVFTASGLPTGYPWVLTLHSSTEGNISWEILGVSFNLTAPSGSPYAWAVGAAGYMATPATGSLVVGGNSTVAVVFAPPATTGTLSATVTPANATLTVDGAAVTGSGGTFSVPLAPGVHAVVATVPGYYTYYTNVSVSLGVTTSLTISMTPVPSSSSSSSNSGISSMAWLLIAVVAVLAVVFLATTLYFMGRSRKPPAMAPYQSPAPASAAAGPTPPPPPGAAGGTPPGAPPPWSEGGSPPPGAQ
jgi:thermopsin